MSPEQKLKNALATLAKQGCEDLTLLNGESAKSLKKKYSRVGNVSTALIIVYCKRQGISIKIDDFSIGRYVETFERELAK